MTKKKRKKKKRIVKAEPGKTLREVRAEHAYNTEDSWPWPLRPYQQKSYDKLLAGIRRQILIWHRRAGKDVHCLSIARNQSRLRIGGYVHFFPKHVQAKRAIWQGIDPKKGQRFIEIAFGDMIADVNNTDMFLEMYNGSTWQLLGSDNYDRVVGSNAVCVVFSEWALCDPRAWDFIRPIILENDGIAIFITTYRGRNHAWQMANQLRDNPEWYVDIRSIEQTTDIDGNRILTDEDMQRERDSGMSEALLQQEYYCNPEAIAEGAIYGKQVERLRREKHRQLAAWNPAKPVYAVWNFDLPIFASCLMIQPGTPPQILDAQTWHFLTLGEAFSRANQHRWPIHNHLIDMKHQPMMQQMADLDVHPAVLTHRNVLTVTTNTSNFLEQCSIDGARCDTLLDSLSGYVRREHFNAQVADMQYAENPAVSWYQQMAFALETWAAWEYHSQGGEWSPAPDYSVQDRIAKTIL